MRNFRPFLLLTLLGGFTTVAWAEDTPDEAADAVDTIEIAEETEASEEAPNGDGVNSPKTMTGMSILGNEEAPKSLVIIPWKSSRMGEEISLADTLDDRARPVDKDVFLRELRFHEIRSGEQT